MVCHHCRIAQPTIGLVCEPCADAIDKHDTYFGRTYIWGDTFVKIRPSTADKQRTISRPLTEALSRPARDAYIGYDGDTERFRDQKTLTAHRVHGDMNARL